MRTRERLLDEAARQIAARGPANTSFRTLASALGIKSSSVHYHLGSKDALLTEVAVRQRRSFAASAEAEAEAGAPPRARAMSVVGTFLGSQRAGAGCVCAAIGAHPAQLTDETRGALAAYFDALTAHLEAAYREGLGPGAQPRRLATMTLSALEGALLLSLVRGDDGPLRDVEAWVGGLFDGAQGDGAAGGAR